MKKNKMITYALIASMMFTGICHTQVSAVKADAVKSTTIQATQQPVPTPTASLIPTETIPPKDLIQATTSPCPTPNGWAILRGNNAYNKETPGDVCFLIDEHTKYGYQLYVDDVELQKDIDYVRDDAAEQLITIKQSFLDTLSAGQHMVKYVYFDDVSEKTTYASLTVISQKVSIDIEPQYKVNETSGLRTKGVVYIPGNGGLYIPRNNPVLTEKIILDGKKLSILDWFSPYPERNYYKIIYMDSVTEGIHYIEMVYDDDTEDIIPLIVLPKGTGEIDVPQPTPIINVQPTPVMPKVSPEPTHTATKEPPVTGTQKPTATVSPKPTSTHKVADIDFIPDVKNNGSSVKQSYRIHYSNEKQPLKLSDLKIRLYYESAGKKSQEFHCDHAGLQLNEAPYYKDCTANINGEFKDGYLEIAYHGDELLKDGELALDTRCNQSDWSAYQNVVIEKIALWYDGSLVYTKKI